jgi:hypothetical protein
MASGVISFQMSGEKVNSNHEMHMRAGSRPVMEFPYNRKSVSNETVVRERHSEKHCPGMTRTSAAMHCDFKDEPVENAPLPI